jgi:hypothetical protein
MKKSWLRWTLKILLVYLLACTPDMVKLAMMGAPVSVTAILFILVSSIVSPWLYVFRMFGGELAYFPAFAPFAVIFAIGLAVVWWTERKRKVQPS